jgi:hypothetical protein
MYNFVFPRPSNLGFEWSDPSADGHQSSRRLTAGSISVERGINGLSPDQRLAARRKDIAPLVNELIAWMKRKRQAEAVQVL